MRPCWCSCFRICSAMRSNTARPIGRRQRETFRSAVHAGVKQVFGTDNGGVFPAGQNALQFAKQLPERVKLSLIYAGNGTLWTDLEKATTVAPLELLRRTGPAAESSKK